MSGGVWGSGGGSGSGGGWASFMPQFSGGWGTGGGTNSRMSQFAGNGFLNGFPGFGVGGGQNFGGPNGGFFGG